LIRRENFLSGAEPHNVFAGSVRNIHREIPVTQHIPKGPAARPVVLVVDDEAAIRAYVCEYLRDSGFHTLAVDSADNAIRLLSRGLAADLVFSDVRTRGERDGYTLARWISENRPEVPVILTSGEIGKENAAALLCHAEMLRKPYELNWAADKIRQTIGRRKPVPN
jgi:CheY-like chemotaxis protein